MHMPHRTWFPFIMIGVTIGFIVFVAAYWEPSIPQTSSQPLVELPSMVAPSVADYQSEVRSIVNEFEGSGDVENAYSQLLDVRVPASYKDFHFDLAVAMGEFRVGEEAEGRVKLDLIKKESAWLNQ